jgi:hypothetical protein
VSDAAGDDAAGLEFTVGACHGAGGEAEVAGELADCG